MTFYLKYRPQTIDELDITSVRVTLTNILNSGSIPHAFLFSGPRGTGKTSSARILAKAINCESKLKNGEPCNKCEHCTSISNGTNIDVIEMDGASNRGIDDIRALRDVVKLAPANSKAKVYIIDEAHMLTTEASNALLKTLEEPPAHVYFVLATTNPEKLIETIKSRTTVVPFTKATPEEIARSLKRVVTGEKIKISDEDLIKIAKISKGSFRDGVKALEQYSSDESFLSNQTGFEISGFIGHLENKNIKKILDEVSKAIKSGTTAIFLTEMILDELRTELLAMSGVGSKKYNFEKNDLIALIELLIQSVNDVKVSPIEELPLEIAFIKWMNEDVVDVSNEPEPAIKKEPKIVVETKKVEIEENPKKKDLESQIQTERVSAPENLEELDTNNWSKILLGVRPINASIEGLLRSAKPLGMDGKVIKLGVYYKFHKDKLEETKTKKMLEDVALGVFGRDIRIECMLTETPPKVQLTDASNQNIISVAEEMFS